MINLSSITLRRGPEPLLEQASVTVHPGQKIGLVGANGSGKSTLLALLLGEISLDAGELSIPADWTIAHMAQQIDELDRPAIEFVIDGDERLRTAERAVATAERNNDGHAIATAHARLEEADGYTAAARAGSLLNGLGFSPQEHASPVGDFSGGWRIRLSLARALMTPSDLLLLDEPTNHLDMETAEWLEGWLGRYAGTLVVISHDRDFLDNIAERIVHIEHRKLNSYTGGYSSFERQRAEQLALQQASHEKQQQKIAHMQSFVDRFRAKASKARQAQARIKAMERMEKVAPAHVDSPFDLSFPEPGRASTPLLHLDEVSLGYGDRVVLDRISTSLARGDRTALLGLNGAGKSPLVRALAGDLEPLAGQLARSRGLEIGYFAQHQLEQLDADASPLTHLQRLAPDEHEQRLRDYLGGFNFIDDMATRPVEGVSGGEKDRKVPDHAVGQALWSSSRTTATCCAPPSTISGGLPIVAWRRSGAAWTTIASGWPSIITATARAPNGPTGPRRRLSIRPRAAAPGAGRTLTCGRGFGRCKTGQESWNASWPRRRKSSAPPKPGWPIRTSTAPIKSSGSTSCWPNRPKPDSRLSAWKRNG